MQILSISDSRAIPLALKLLNDGQLVIYPTETCYGIAADCQSAQAIDRLLEYKGDRHRQIAIAVSNQTMAEKYVSLNETAKNLYQEFLPGPITVISDSLHLLDARLESVQGTLGVRIPDYTFALKLIESNGTPLTATSANTSGKKEPYSLEDWQKYTAPNKQKMVALFLDAGKLKNRPTSTVVDTTLNDPQILRQGGLVIPALAPTFTSRSESDTLALARELTLKHLALSRRFPLILALQGDLGVGKTQFVKGVAQELGVDLTISSPTYTLMKEYPYALLKYSGTLYHIDTWRLSDPMELESTIHLSTLLKPGNIIAIEWAGKAKNLLESYENDVPILVINIKDIGDNIRQISYAFSTPEWS